MARWAPARADVIGEYADEVLQLFPRGRILVGIDGLDGAGKTTFARELAEALDARGVPAAALSLGTAYLPTTRVCSGSSRRPTATSGRSTPASWRTRPSTSASPLRRDGSSPTPAEALSRAGAVRPRPAAGTDRCAPPRARG